jgi:hypothetical protein
LGKSVFALDLLHGSEARMPPNEKDPRRYVFQGLGDKADRMTDPTVYTVANTMECAKRISRALQTLLDRLARLGRTA